MKSYKGWEISTKLQIHGQQLPVKSNKAIGCFLFTIFEHPRLSGCNRNPIHDPPEYKSALNFVKYVATLSFKKKHEEVETLSQFNYALV